MRKYKFYIEFTTELQFDTKEQVEAFLSEQWEQTASSSVGDELTLIDWERL